MSNGKPPNIFDLICERNSGNLEWHEVPHTNPLSNHYYLFMEAEGCLGGVHHSRNVRPEWAGVVSDSIGFCLQDGRRFGSVEAMHAGIGVHT